MYDYSDLAEPPDPRPNPRGTMFDFDELPEDLEHHQLCEDIDQETAGQQAEEPQPQSPVVHEPSKGDAGLPPEAAAATEAPHGEAACHQTEEPQPQSPEVHVPGKEDAGVPPEVTAATETPHEDAGVPPEATAATESPHEDIGLELPIFFQPEGGAPTTVNTREAMQIFLERRRKKGPASAAIFSHRNSEQPVRFGARFGNQRAPVVFLEALAPDVAKFVCEDPDGPFAELEVEVREQYWENWGFNEDKKETMLKQDWHSLPHICTEGKFFVPRLAEGDILGRAPPRTMAFVVAFRVVNKACWAAMADVLEGLLKCKELWVLARWGEKGLKDYRASRVYSVVESVTACIRTQRHFGVVEAQIRWGPEDHRMPSHKDGATSLLHLSLTLSGRRTVWAGTFERKDSRANPIPKQDEQGGVPMKRPDPEKNVYDEQVWHPSRLQQIEMTHGCAYISSPFCFEHAVEYFACSHQEPVIALQCRFAFTQEMGKQLNNLRTQEMLEISTIIAESLRAAGTAGQLRMPTLKEVMQADEQLRAELESKLQNQ